MNQERARELAEEILPKEAFYEELDEQDNLIKKHDEWDDGFNDCRKKSIEAISQALLSSRLVEVPSIMQIQRGLGVGFSQAQKIVNFLKGETK